MVFSITLGAKSLATKLPLSFNWENLGQTFWLIKNKLYEKYIYSTSKG